MKLLVLFACISVQIYFASAKINLCTSAKTIRGYTDCLHIEFDAAKASFVDGFPKYNIPPLNPYKQEKLFFKESLPGILDLEGVISKIEVHGFDAVQLKDLHLDPKQHFSGADFFLPYVSIKEKYSIAGNVLNKNITDSGSFEVYFENVEVRATATHKFITKDGIKYPQFEKISLKFKVGGGKAKLVSQDPELQLLADGLINIFNRDPQYALFTIYNIFGDLVDGVFKKVGNEIFTKLPALEIMPPHFLF